MGWLIRRAFVVWMILIAICAVVVGIVRANGGPGSLQAMGFGVCEGKPCFRGIKAGMDWDIVKASHPDGVVEHDLVLLPNSPA